MNKKLIFATIFGLCCYLTLALALPALGVQVVHWTQYPVTEEIAFFSSAGFFIGMLVYSGFPLMRSLTLSGLFYLCAFGVLIVIQVLLGSFEFDPTIEGYARLGACSAALGVFLGMR